MKQIYTMKQIDVLQALDLKEGQSIELLKELHILTSDGKINQDSRRKLKQVLHLTRFIATAVAELGLHNDADLTVADMGSGKSYLGFILYDLYFKSWPKCTIYGIEARADLVTKCQALSEKIGFSRMKFLAANVADIVTSTDLPKQIDVITALHACDTATDDAIAFGLAKKAKLFVLVPCCQAEVARLLNVTKQSGLSHNSYAELWRHPLHTREFGSHITNVFRCLYLQANGYQVTVTELVGWEHSMKNELLIARYTGQKMHSAKTRLLLLLEQMGLSSLIASRFILN
jgi:Methyltransferase domain